MNRNRKRPSRFDSSPSNNMNYGGNRGGLSYNQNDVFSSRDLGPSSMQIHCKTQEQLAFVCIKALSSDPAGDFSRFLDCSERFINSNDSH